MTPEQQKFIESLNSQVMMNYIKDMLSDKMAMTSSTFILGVSSPVRLCQPVELFDAFVSVLRERLIFKLRK